MRVFNTHSRHFRVDCQQVAPLLDALSSEQDPLWPRQHWPRLRLNGPLAPGSVGGHGPIRYQVADYQPGQWVEFSMLQPHLWSGYHRLEIVREAGGCRLVHHLEFSLTWRGALTWWLAVRWLHDALLEDALDRAECLLHGSVPAAARWSPWVQLLRKLALWMR